MNAIRAGLALLVILAPALIARADDAAPEPAKPPDAPAPETPAPPKPEPPRPEPAKPDLARDAAATQRALVEKKLSIDLKGIPLQDALGMLATTAGVGLAIDGHIEAEKLREPLELKLERASVYAVLHWVFLKRDLTWVVRGHDVLVAPPRFLDPDVANRHNEWVTQTEDAWEASARPKLSATKLSLDVSEVPLENVLRIVAERAGMGLVWANDAEKSRRRQVSLKIADASLADVLDKLAAAAELDWGLEAEAIVLSPK